MHMLINTLTYSQIHRHTFICSHIHSQSHTDTLIHTKIHTSSSHADSLTVLLKIQRCLVWPSPHQSSRKALVEHVRTVTLQGQFRSWVWLPGCATHNPRTSINLSHIQNRISISEMGKQQGSDESESQVWVRISHSYIQIFRVIKLLRKVQRKRIETEGCPVLRITAPTSPTRSPPRE